MTRLPRIAAAAAVAAAALSLPAGTKTAFYTSSPGRAPECAGTVIVPDTVKDLKDAAGRVRSAKREFYISFPVNEIFGQKGKKPAHPERCMGEFGKDPPHAPWCAQDYANDAVRGEYVRRVLSAAREFAPDGVMLDFMRVPAIFKTVARGGTATPRERAALTGMVKDIRSGLDAARPDGARIALVANVPDSAAYASAIGIDLAAWLAEKGLLDAFAVGTAFQLNDWTASGELARRFGVPLWITLDTSGISFGNDSMDGAADDERFPRQCVETYRARMADAMRAAPDAIVYVDPRANPLPAECVVPPDPEAVAGKNKRYFVTWRNTKSIGHFLSGGRKFAALPSLVSSHPVVIPQNGSLKYPIRIMEKGCTQFELVTETDIPSGTDTAVYFNGRLLKTLRRQAGCQMYELPADAVKFGLNEVVVKASGRNKRGQPVKLRNIGVDAIRNPGGD